ncbi:DUF4097 family beta strand repeat-containing protein [Brevibacillus daliensis]|uniref:DUF4097 family beta strand repeat-containing protein n=1 Tax=Brevibacillus daliensis TaxID=2892995 RepID=UPI001E41A603|nr:DUF4097 family beta strand repeat-containing protein [Brevibacillus daliensis]
MEDQVFKEHNYKPPTRYKRVGIWQLAVAFVAIGCVILADRTWDTDYLGMILPFWPVLLIAIGLELILYQLFSKDDTNYETKISFKSIFILILLVGGTYTYYMITEGNFFNNMGNYIYRGPVENHMIVEKDVPFAEAENIRITNPFGKVIVEGSADKNVHLSVSANLKADDVNNVEEYLKDIQVILREGSTSSVTIEDPKHRARDIDIIMRVPAHMNIQTKVDAGSIMVTNVASAELHSNAGTITVDQITKKLQAATNAGEIQASNVNSANLESNVGKIEVKNEIRGDLTIKNDVGKVEVTATSSPDGDWKLINNIGKVEITIPRESNVTLSGETELGSIDMIDQTFSSHEDRNMLKEKLGTGQNNIRVETGVGNILFQLTE